MLGPSSYYTLQISCLINCTEINSPRLYNQRASPIMKSTKDANSLWENLCESQSHPFSLLTAFDRGFRPVWKERHGHSPSSFPLFSPSYERSTCDRPTFWLPLKLARNALLFRQTWDSPVSWNAMSVRYLSSCLKITNHLCFFHLGKYHPLTCPICTWKMCALSVLSLVDICRIAVNLHWTWDQLQEIWRV